MLSCVFFFVELVKCMCVTESRGPYHRSSSVTHSRRAKGTSQQDVECTQRCLRPRVEEREHDGSASLSRIFSRRVIGAWVNRKADPMCRVWEKIQDCDAFEVGMSGCVGSKRKDCAWY